jgi:hypothetical protein
LRLLSLNPTKDNAVAKTIVVIASAFLFTVLGLSTGIAINLLRPDSPDTAVVFTVFSMVAPTAAGALFGACVGAFAVGIGSRNA